MTFNESIKHCLKNYFTTKGRATRSEYWWFQLFWCMTLTIECIILNITSEIAEELSFFLVIIEFLITFALLIPNICVCVRRLHDTGWPGNTLLWCLCGIALPFIHGCIQSLNPMLNETNREITAGSFAGSFILGIFIGLIIVNIRNLFKSDADNIYGQKIIIPKKHIATTETSNNNNQSTTVTSEEEDKTETTEVKKETKANYCRFCGKPTTPETMFCIYCGKPLNQKSRKAAVINDSWHYQQAKDKNAEHKQQEEEQKKD